MSAATVSQIVSAAANIIYAGALLVAYYLIVKLYREMLQEMREQRMAKERPQVLVQADYGHLPEIDLVIKNISGGAAKEITFDFSSRIESSSGFNISELPYFSRGINFLGPEGEIRCFWDYLDDLIPVLKREGLTEGITVTVRYKDLSGKLYEDRWTFNPLLYEENRSVRQRDTSDLVEAVEKVSEKLDEVLKRDGAG